MEFVHQLPLNAGLRFSMKAPVPSRKSALSAISPNVRASIAKPSTPGSIPIVALFESILGIKTVLLGFGLDTDDIHSPNEHYGLFNFYKGIETIPYYFMYYAEMKKS